MSRWMVNVRGQQFSASNMDELKKLAKRGELGAGDIVQPPGASEWLYALEVPELKTALRAEPGSEYDMTAPAREMSPMLKWASAGVLVLVAVGAWSYALSLSDLPTIEDVQLVGKKGLDFTEVLVTAEDAVLRAEANANAAEAGPLPKNAKAELLGKRGEWYRLRHDGKEGYAKIDQIVPAYYFGNDKDKQEHDPLYNPDRYVSVRNSAWMTVPGQKDEITVFNFLIGNDSRFEMTDLKMVAAIKDKNDKVLEQKEIAVEGPIPAGGGTMVGMIKADPRDKTSVDRIMTSAYYEKLLGSDPTLAERWVDGVEVTLGSKDTVGAMIEIVEVRAIPPDQAPATQASAGG